MIYLDNNATTPVLPEVVEAMLPFYTELWGNPSSLHTFGAQVTRHIDNARERVAKLLGAQRANEIIFTSGGTEANNLALRGVLQADPSKRHIVTTAVEHPSVLMLCQKLEKEGFEVTYLPVNTNGELSLSHLEAALKKETALVSALWANNETGVLFPAPAIAKICEEKNVVFHVDATQAVGKIPIDLKKTGISLLSLSGHKFHAPKGIGALYLSRGTKLSAQIIGGHQERSRRAGTENVAGIVGFGKAAELAGQRQEKNIFQQIEKRRNELEQNILRLCNRARVNGAKAKRLPNTASISLEGCDGETICLLLSEEGIAVSTGSACSAGSLEPSHVLKAMGLTHKQAKGTIRFSLSFETTPQEIEQTLASLEKILRRLKQI